MAHATPYLGKLILDHMFQNAVWTPPDFLYMGLLTNVEGITEVVNSGGSAYARQLFPPSEVPFGTNEMLSFDPINFTGMPSVTLAGACLYDASSAGNPLLVAAMSVPLIVETGATVAYAAGTLKVVAR